MGNWRREEKGRKALFFINLELVLFLNFKSVVYILDMVNNNVCIVSGF